ncbi:MAG: MFS transporter [Rickettsia endosymbiont of Ixodes persulcatus]|nr:MFS transporter [Rickettsia endosymbiont of Ixodes persulcatus]MCZ6903292.1 MFS transporter [Rickettsia endosymbiont of Ixodes persulcatus]MCZ6909178.1 MFS transporter [Rickettsia endosymbiont of Ixodes persulcatus]MCZ6911040.1 MFS transporter [Rickettsia endosymbiont of Ixodes persulcatus]MCZ6913357.1 MFS transporter [Rickettsia endosymbiont of Ixodes persulcatus]
MSNSAFLVAFFTIIIRYYDYALFGLSASILAQNFLPSIEQDKQLLGFFAVLSAAVIVRPLGSLIFGFIGDKYGRTKSIKISMFISSISTGLIAITPSFEMMGIFATVILTLCRMVFLASLAGEVDGIKVYVAEKTGYNRKNLNIGIVSCCSQIGALLAAIAYYYASNSSIEYLWRFNFFIGAIFGLFAILMRNFFKESSEFLYYKNTAQFKKLDTSEFCGNVGCADSSLNSSCTKLFELSCMQQIKIIKDNLLSFIIALLINGAIGGVYHFLVIFLGVFLAKIAFINYHEIGFMNIALTTTYGISALFAGLLADKINPLKQIIWALFASIIVALWMQIMLYKQIFNVLCPVILIGLAAFYAVPLQIIVQSLFKTNVKMRLYSLSHSFGGIILSSSAPFFSMLLWQNFKSLSLTLSFFICLLIILISTVLVLRKRK